MRSRSAGSIGGELMPRAASRCSRVVPVTTVMVLAWARSLFSIQRWCAQGGGAVGFGFAAQAVAEAVGALVDDLGRAGRGPDGDRVVLGLVAVAAVGLHEGAVVTGPGRGLGGARGVGGLPGGRVHRVGQGFAVHGGAAPGRGPADLDGLVEVEPGGGRGAHGAEVQPDPPARDPGADRDAAVDLGDKAVRREVGIGRAGERVLGEGLGEVGDRVGGSPVGRFEEGEALVRPAPARHHEDAERGRGGPRDLGNGSGSQAACGGGRSGRDQGAQSGDGGG
ncbi:hypothetical protein CNX65_27140 [Actinosynnema pretiosum]|uniref:Uncharacterized protein n=1 Tax=Actinosynnema pretiosum TaxID=42197 RepID=A0A290ZBW7_9PSEU|nr:hypothetical protein CNX65_27140 [Actinosynnema pretiosum]